MTAQRKSQPRSSTRPDRTTNTAGSVAPAVPHDPDGAFPNQCGATCVRPTPSQAHCAASGCHRAFGGVTGFDAHRKDGACLDPATLGMVRSDRGIWRMPMSDEDMARRFGTAPTAGSVVAR